MTTPMNAELALHLSADREAGFMEPVESGVAEVRVEVAARAVAVTIVHKQASATVVIALEPATALQLGERLIEAARACSPHNGVTPPDAGPAGPRPRGRTVSAT
jgi:hypothetical protein